MHEPSVTVADAHRRSITITTRPAEPEEEEEEEGEEEEGEEQDSFKAPDQATAGANIPASFFPGPKISADGKTIFHKNPAREAHDAEWRDRLIRAARARSSISTSNSHTATTGNHTSSKSHGDEGCYVREHENTKDHFDPYAALKARIDATPTSSFVEYWWRKARGKEKTRAAERVKREAMQVRREEEGQAGLLREGGAGAVMEEEDDNDGGYHERRDGRVDGAVESRTSACGLQRNGRGKEERHKWHDKIRWGL